MPVGASAPTRRANSIPYQSNKTKAVVDHFIPAGLAFLLSAFCSYQTWRVVKRHRIGIPTFGQLSNGTVALDMVKPSWGRTIVEGTITTFCAVVCAICAATSMHDGIQALDKDNS